MNNEANFRTRGGKHITLSGIYRILGNPFYYGEFEYPKGGGKFYKGTHEPLITKELFEEVRALLAVAPRARPGTKEFAFTKMITCGNCGYGITAEEKIKRLKNGTIQKYVYYHCSRFDHTCKQPYIREDELLNQLLNLIDNIDLSKAGLKKRLEAEVEKMNKFTADVLGMQDEIKIPKMDVRGYAKYVLRNGVVEEKRELLGCLISRLILTDRKLSLCDGNSMESALKRANIHAF